LIPFYHIKNLRVLFAVGHHEFTVSRVLKKRISPFGKELVPYWIWEGKRGI
jgi:hypothetical protein